MQRNLYSVLDRKNDILIHCLAKIKTFLLCAVSLYSAQWSNFVLLLFIDMGKKITRKKISFRNADRRRCTKENMKRVNILKRERGGERERERNELFLFYIYYPYSKEKYRSLNCQFAL